MKRRARSQLTAGLATLLGLLMLASSSASAPTGEKGKPKQKGCEVEAEGSLSDKRTFEVEAELEDGELHRRRERDRALHCDLPRLGQFRAVQSHLHARVVGLYDRLR